MNSPEQQMAAYLRPRGVSLKYAKDAGLRHADAALAKTMGFAPARAGIVIPYLHPFTRVPHPTLVRIRYFDPPRKDFKFAQPKETPVEAYFDPHVDWKKVAKNTSTAIHFVEGEVKALAMNQNGFVTIGLGGVDSFGGPELTAWLREVLG